VDMGAVWNSTYTVLAGGTHPDFPGVAKLINLHHMEWACHQELGEVDFLCGEFNWKQRFHLMPRPLYKIIVSRAQAGFQDDVVSTGKIARAAKNKSPGSWHHSRLH
jgi:CelD/BcsL family acetyltransferase involved in cellulose biosynthesis